jgi:3-oxoacyl-[acyl-carrier protein] reductase
MKGENTAGPRRWLVTGASRGIGRAIAARAIAGGDKVSLLSRGDGCKAVAEEFGPNAMGVVADVANPRSVELAVDEAVLHFGGLDVVVNNAGVHRGGRVDALDLDNWEETIATNLSGALHVVRAALAHLKAGASIVNVGAVVGFRGFPGDACYGASKAGLAGLTQVLSAELAPKGIRANLVIPGFVMSDMTAGVSKRARDEIIANIPMGRMGSAEEIADVVWWVAGSTYMSGSVIATDGGLMGRL